MQRINVRYAKAALQRLRWLSKAALGRSRQVGFSAPAKCCGTAFGKEGSQLPFAALRANVRLAENGG